MESFRLQKSAKIIEANLPATLPRPPLTHDSKWHICWDWTTFCEKLKYKQILIRRKFSPSTIPLKIKVKIKLHQGLQKALQTEGAP